MGGKLVVVESPAKAKTIGKILGREFTVKSSMGHVRDLPVNSLGVEIARGFKPKYVLVKGRKRVVDELKRAAGEAEAIYLAPDPDREGEAIAWHLMHLLKRHDGAARFFRVQYNEITPAAVRRAFEHPGELDMARVNAQQARRILDRIVGYKVSPFLWRRIRRGLSAGRVQSVALRLVCEREREILKFVPEAYWLMGALARKRVPPPDPFRIRLVRIGDEKADIRSAERVEAIRADLEGRSLSVADIAEKEISRRPMPPHITSTLQQAGSTYCGMSPSRTMAIAQKLYEGVDLGEGPVGLITYMRTDSFNVAAEAIEGCRALIRARFGAEYCPERPNYYRSRDTAQQAHEAIRPTDVTRTPDSVADRLAPGELKLYRLIWQRFVASQMAPARVRQRTVTVAAPPPAGRTTEYLFQATASTVVFPGHLRAVQEKAEDREKADGDGDEVESLPELHKGESLECVEWLSERKETTPPQRYSEASLVRALESNGVGRPSTYAQIITTLHQRRYVQKDRRSLLPTELGFQVNDLLTSNLGKLFDVTFTAAMEESLDEVEDGAVEWTAMLDEFYRQFDGWMSSVREPSADRSVVLKLLAAMEPIQAWAPDVQTGRRTYSDRKFVESIRAQVQAQGKDVSQRQLDTLVRIASRYAGQAPQIRAVIVESGYAERLEETERNAPRESTIRKLDLLQDAGLDERAEKFIASLRARVTGGRELSEAQIHALNSVVLRHADSIPGFQQVRGELDLDTPPPQDNESGAMLAALDGVKSWRPSVRRGNTVFDDQAFFESLRSHFRQRGFLSPRQKFALRRLVRRYERPGYKRDAAPAGAHETARGNGAAHKETGHDG